MSGGKGRGAPGVVFVLGAGQVMASASGRGGLLGWGEGGGWAKGSEMEAGGGLWDRLDEDMPA